MNKYHVSHKISVDIVPALHINDWLPDTARAKELCRADDCLIVFTQPQSNIHGSGGQNHTDSYHLLQQKAYCCMNVIQSQKLLIMTVKRLSKYFCRYEFFSLHVMKMALLWCLDKNDLMKYRSSRKSCLYSRSSHSSDEVNGCELLCLVQNILRQLLCFAAQDYVPSYFMPRCHLPVFLKERYLKQYHMRLYQHGLTYKDLFNLSEEQSHDEVLQSIKTMFTFSHVMYWTVLSETDEFKLFVPSIINPLCETSYV